VCNLAFVSCVSPPQGSAFGLSWPPPDELAKIVISIVICGALSSAATTAIEGYMARRSGAKAKTK